MNATDGLILWTERTSRAHQPQVGEKAALLGELAHLGFPVPPGFTVTTRVFAAFLDANNLAEPLARRWGNLSPDNPGRVLATSSKMMKLALQATVPKEIAEAVRSAYQKLGGGPVAVWADGVKSVPDDGSAAGYLFSQSNIQTEQGLLEAIKQGWAATFAPREVHYRADHYPSQTDLAPAVMVQRMVQPEVSGVLMTLDPFYNDDSKVVGEAVWGLGRVLSEEPVTPEAFILEKNTARLISRKPAVQRHKLVQDSTAAPGSSANTAVDLSEDEGHRSRLTESQLERLVHLGCEIEAALGEPVEVEWAKPPAEATFYVLQVRPLRGFSASGRAVRPGSHDMTGKLLLTGDPVTPALCSGRVRV
ncbi:MAG: PEP/pyruvate-binding domain-containing protein, partial [Chloroflexota bacterium]